MNSEDEGEFIGAKPIASQGASQGVVYRDILSSGVPMGSQKINIFKKTPHLPRYGNRNEIEMGHQSNFSCFCVNLEFLHDKLD